MNKIIILLSALVLAFGFVEANTETIICKKVSSAVRKIMWADEIICGSEDGLLQTTNEANVKGVILGSLNMSYCIESLNLWIGMKSNENPTFNLVQEMDLRIISNRTMNFRNRVLRRILLRPVNGILTIFIGGTAMLSESVSGNVTIISDRTMLYVLQHNGTTINF
ncbi:unnamed protein product [Gordionus sp. m RMFG-2023]|uniref:uncharacterized protein LOC135927593 isoform X2 n=1 Tax=Gordionus sp. m RMFG-2023 TaxID=3053472 RepID=UPI0030E206B5